MKKLLLLIAVNFVISLFFFSLPCFSQKTVQPNDSIIPSDTCVRAGELSNGLTFYIRHNDTQPHQVSFYLVQRVGSILEDDNQRGLAHFLEHMCFEGTNYFPGQTIAHYLQSRGVKYGFDLNAATGYDKTIYNIEDVPVTSPCIVDTCLYVLSEWAHGLTLDSLAIEKERKVIHEEWRSGMSSETRMLQKAAPDLFPNCKYANRFPIGTMDVVDHFPIQVLKDYYHKWYRPDLQAIIVVGDIDVDKIQKLILQFFKHTYLKPNCAFRAYEPVADNADSKPLISIQTDPEETQTHFALIFKRQIYDTDAKDKPDYYVLKYVKKMVETLCDQRLAHYTAPDMPVISTDVSDGNYLNSYTKDALCVDAIYRKGQFDDALQAILYEIRRILQYGFTQKEYDKVKNDYVAALNNNFNNRQNITNNTYIQQYIKNFLENEPYPSPEDEYKIMKKFTDEIPLPAVNYYATKMMDMNNLAIYCTGPEKKGYHAPKRGDILNDIDVTKGYDLTAWQDGDDDNTVIMKHKPKAGSILSETNNAQLGTIEMKLSNGVKVIIKKIDTKQDEIKMAAVANGGLALFPESYAPTLQAMDILAERVGFGNHYAGELSTLTNGMTVDVKPDISGTKSAMNGHCAVNDLETMLQITNLRFSKPKYDFRSFAYMQDVLREYLRNHGIKPEHVFRDSLMNVAFDYSPRVWALNRSLAGKVKYGQIKDIYNGCYSDASKYTFIFCGNVDVSKLRPLIKQYIASLPTDKDEEELKTYESKSHKGVKTVDFKQNMFTQKGMVGFYQGGTCEYTAKNELMIDMAAQVMENRLIEKIRQKEGAAYSVDLKGDLENYPSPNFNFLCVFDINPVKIDLAAKDVNDELDYWKEHAPTIEELNEVKEFKKKRYELNVKLSDYWISILSDMALAHVDRYSDYCNQMKSITPDELQKFVAGLIQQNNRITITMRPQ